MQPAEEEGIALQSLDPDASLIPSARRSAVSTTQWQLYALGAAIAFLGVLCLTLIVVMLVRPVVVVPTDQTAPPAPTATPLPATEPPTPAAPSPCPQPSPTPTCPPPTTCPAVSNNSAQLNPWQQKFLSLPQPSKCKAALRMYTSRPHIAGTQGDWELVQYTRDQFTSFGLETEVVQYDVLLTYPISASLTVGPIAYTCNLTEPSLPQDRTSNDTRMPKITWHGHSGNGNVSGRLLYINYGLESDWAELKRRNISAKGCVVIARYGGNFRGIKAMLAEENGAIGIIIYSDPADDGNLRGPTYPDGPWRPPQAAQRGSVQFLPTYSGDPSTPGRASVPNLPATDRLPIDKCNIPSIPTQPLAYGEAYYLLSQIGGPVVLEGWQGGLPFTYHIGPGPATVQLRVQQNYTVTPIWNVIGTIPGLSLEQQVILGNHRDSWAFGGVDPGSGSSVLMEVARAFGRLYQEGWRPQRTIKIMSWDAEEYGLIGSTEYAEQYPDVLSERTVAYLNVDEGAFGRFFTASASPALADLIRDVLGEVRDPDTGVALREVTLQQQNAARAAAGLPPLADVSIGDLGSGSDFTPFFQHLGISSTDMSFSGAYGVYHSIYDSFDWMANFGDPTFEYSAVMTQIWGLLGMKIADAIVLPFNYSAYSLRMQAEVNFLQTLVPRGALDWTVLTSALSNFSRSAAAALSEATAWTKGNGIAEQLQGFNTRLYQAERKFLLPNGLDGRPFYKHAVFAPGLYTGYAAAVFPDVRERIDVEDWVGAQQAMLALADVIQQAAEFLIG